MPRITRMVHLLSADRARENARRERVERLRAEARLEALLRRLPPAVEALTPAAMARAS